MLNLFRKYDIKISILSDFTNGILSHSASPTTVIIFEIKIEELILKIIFVLLQIDSMSLIVIEFKK